MTAEAFLLFQKRSQDASGELTRCSTGCRSYCLSGYILRRGLGLLSCNLL